MKNEIQILTDALQKEQDHLEEEMNICIKDFDFEGAEAFKKALFYTRNKLARLEELANPNYRKIKDLQMKIEAIKNPQARRLNPESVKKHMEPHLSKWKEELANLEQLAPKYIDSDEIISCLEKMIKNELEFFHIEIDEIDLDIVFKKVGEGIEIEIKNIVEKKGGSSNFKFLKNLKKMSFKIEDDSAILKIEKLNTSEISKIMMILSRVIFDNFRFYKNDKVANIIFKTP